MSSFDSSTLAIEAESIIRGTEHIKAWTYIAQFIVGNEHHDVLKVISIDEEADYTQDFADNIRVEVLVGAGTYAKKILPFKENVRFKLDRVPTDMEGRERQELTIESRLFNVIIADVQAPQMAGSTPEYNVDADTMDIMSLLRVTIELTEINIDLIRTMEFGTVLVAMRPTEAVRSTLSFMKDKITQDVESKIKHVNIVDTDNDTIIEQLVIPHGTKVVDFPDYVHNRVGLYNSGLGFFYRDLCFYVWPLYNFKRAEHSERKITFIIAPQNRFPGIERTYRTTANQVIVLITGGATVIDTSEHFAQNEGSGIRLANASDLLESFAKTSKGRTAVKRSEGVTEMIGMQRAGDLNKVVTRPSSNNIYKETSAIAARVGNRMMVVWQNSDPSLLEPDTPCEVIIEKNGLPIFLGAALLGTHHFTGSPSNSAKAGLHRTTSLLTLYVDRDTPEVKEYRDNINKDWYNPVAVDE